VSDYNGITENKCYRNGPCLNADPIRVTRSEKWDYYDRESKSFINLQCRLNQKHYSASLLQIEEGEKFQSGLSTVTYETPDLQLHDTNGVWFTRSDDPDMYGWPQDDPKTCNICDLVCDIRDEPKYLRGDETCPYDDPAPYSIYQKVQDSDQPCQDFLHPLLLQDIPAINRRRRRTTKVKLWKYLKQKHWRDALINKGDRIADVWKRNYRPANFYFNSFESIALYLKNLPTHMKQNRHLLKRIRDNLDYSPSFRENLEKGEWEVRMLENIETMVNDKK